MKVLMYTMTFNTNPDVINTCLVPWMVDQHTIFFGPCKTRIREWLRAKYLRDRNCVTLGDAVWLIGVNGANPERVRKVLYFGRVDRVMTFEHAYNYITVTDKYRSMRKHPWTPMFVRPIYDGKRFLGYENISNLHFKDQQDLVMDFCNAHTKKLIRHRKEERKVWLEGNRNDVFVRDCCMTLENGFYAERVGLSFNKYMMRILKKAQPDRKGIDPFAIFGLTRAGVADGRKGSWLLLEGELAETMILELEQAASADRPVNWGDSALKALDEINSHNIDKKLEKCPDGAFKRKAMEIQEWLKYSTLHSRFRWS